MARNTRGSTLSSTAAYGSDIIVDLMRAFDIEYAALNPGATFKWLHDSIVNYGGNARPHLIECTHEEISVAMAHGYAKASGKPMVAIVTDTVGLQHASMAIYNAWCDSVPVIVLGGTGPMDLTIRRPWIDWTHTAMATGSVVRDYVKWDDQPHNLASVPESFIRAYRVATTEPQGPVFVCYDATIQAVQLDGPMSIPDVASYAPATPQAVAPDALRMAASWLAEAERPVVVAEYTGRSEAGFTALSQLADLLSLPVVDRGGSFGAGGGWFNFPSNHPLDLTGAEDELLSQADLVLALDVKDLWGATNSARDPSTYAFHSIVPDSARIIQVSLWEQRIRGWSADYQRIPRVDLNIAADTSVALPQLVAACRELVQQSEDSNSQYQERRLRLKEWHDRLRQGWQSRAHQSAGERPVAVPKLAADLWECIKNEEWALVAGDLDGWTRRIWEFDNPHQCLGESGGAGLGYIAGASIGAALAYKGTGKLCISLQPDGDLLYSPGALWTAAHHKIPILIVMFNNRTYYNSEAHAVDVAQDRERAVENRGVGTWISGPDVDFAGLARSMGVYGEGPVESPEEVIPALQRAIKVVKEQGLPALVDVVCQPR